MGVFASICRSRSSFMKSESASVRIDPTAIPLTRIFGAKSWARFFVKNERADFAVPYAAKPLALNRPAADEMFTIAPPPANSTILGTTSRVISKAVVTLNRKQASNSLPLTSSVGLGGHPPALLTRMSSRPNSSRVFSTSPSLWPASSTSQGTTSARRPRALTFSAVSSSCDSVRADKTTSAPASA